MKSINSLKHRKSYKPMDFRSVKRILVKLAYEMECTTYQDLAVYFNLPMPNDHMYALLDRVLESDTMMERPTVAALVVCERTGIPDDSFFIKFSTLRGCPMPTTIEEKRALHEAEFAAVLRLYIAGE